MRLSGPRPGDLHLQRFSVPFEYPVIFEGGALEPESSALAWAIARREPERRHPFCAVLDEGLLRATPGLDERVRRYAERHADVLELRSDPIRVPGGEAAKGDPALIGALHAAFAKARLDRQAVVLVIGGGAVLDAVGYAASSVHRGLRVVRMPSTVLSQCDGGVGVKTSVNAFSSKNFLGSFAPPYAVVNDRTLLATLPLREARAGMAEAVKVALIRDAAFFEWLSENATALAEARPEPLLSLVRRAALLHLEHIANAGDPFELGSARPLDYGHWSAHRLEIASGHELRHGEAVAIGMLLDARYAERSGYLEARDLARLSSLLGALGLPRYHPALSERVGGRLSVLAGLDEFREHLGGALSVTLLRGIGRPFEANALDERILEDCIAWLAEEAHR
ncbi:MAG: 3-dehydroquinate synthase [Pseudomonadota bacterium]|nr:MAG: 3-dehydroquinate synthase [Pseudomonadota bacterium]